MGTDKKIDHLLNAGDMMLNWARARSLWPMFFGLSCCFVEEATAFTPRYDIARFGAEVIRPSPRQADLLIIAGTVFKKVAPVVLRLYEQMAEPKWVISMGSCSNTGGMYDVYSVVQGVDQILPVDIYIPGCPPRPEAVLQGLTLLQEKIGEERPARSVLGLSGGTQGTAVPVAVVGKTKSRDPRGPGMEGIAVRGSSVSPPLFRGNRSPLVWTAEAPPEKAPPEQRDLRNTLSERFGDGAVPVSGRTDMPVFRVAPEKIKDVLDYLKNGEPGFKRLDDLTAIDESRRLPEPGAPPRTLVYQLLSFSPPRRIRLKVPVAEGAAPPQSITDIWPSAAWYEREVFDMFGISFDGHENLRRILMPHDWKEHPLLKGCPGRATEMPPYTTESARKYQPLSAEHFITDGASPRELVLNLGPHHVSTHGLMRFILSLDGEEIKEIDMDLGYHHRGVEKIGERQTWHQFIPYTDRVDYLAGAANNLPYVLSVESLAGITVPDRALFMRVLLSELFRISNHLVFFGTLAHDVGAMTPTFYTFREREMILDMVETITGGRLHPAFLRIGGCAADLPAGWREPLDDFIKIFSNKLTEYEALITTNPIFRARTKGIGLLSADRATEWGVTGPNLRAAGVSWDLRKAFPYSGYEAFDFDIPVGREGDCYDRYLIRVEEMRQSLSIIAQAARGMPPGPVLSEDFRYGIPPREEMLTHIETLIHHFVNVTEGPKIPAGEAYAACEIPRGEQGYFVVSTGKGHPYRMRIRSPGFANVQVIPDMARGWSISDLIAIIGSVDYILPDIDR